MFYFLSFIIETFNVENLKKNHVVLVFRSSIEHHHNSKNSSSSIPSDSAKESLANDKKKPHIKKPLNAFMLYMKEMRAQVTVEWSFFSDDVVGVMKCGSLTGGGGVYA